MYRRYVEDDFDGGLFRPARFPFPPSLNRQRYSEPQDVIFSVTGEFDQHGVLECSVSALSLRLSDDRQTEFTFVPIHLPEEDNYSHSEMWANCTQTGECNEEPSRIARKMHRTKVSQLFRVRIKSTK